jgi:hypothetical protein
MVRESIYHVYDPDVMKRHLVKKTSEDHDELKMIDKNRKGDQVNDATTRRSLQLKQ